MGQSDTSVTLLVGDEKLELDRWENYSVESCMLTPSDAFSFSAHNSNGELAGVCSTGDAVQVTVDDQVVLMGRVDDVDYQTDDNGSRVDVTGRDLFGNLADCSAPLKVWRNKSLFDIAEELTEQWGVTWTGLYNLDPIPKVKVEPGETVLNLLMRLNEKEHALLWLDPEGVGHIGLPNYAQAPLYRLWNLLRSDPRAATHNNVIECKVHQSWREQFSTTTVYGTSGNTAANYGTSSRRKAQAIDTDIDDRALIVVDGDCKTLSKAQLMADEKVARANFDATVITCKVRGHYGFKDGTATLWSADTMVELVDDYSGTAGTFYVTRRRFTGDDSGRFTELELHPAGLWLA